MQNDTQAESHELTPFRTLYTRRDGQIYGISHIYYGQHQSVVPEDLANAGEGYNHKSANGAERYLIELIQKHEKAEDRFNFALENAENAFWAEIAKAYPEIKSGDIAPDVAVSLTSSLEKAVAAFIIGNVADHAILPNIVRNDLLPFDLDFNSPTPSPANTGVEVPSAEKVKQIKELYKNGTRIKLLETMADDPKPVKAGAYGFVTGVDDAGHIHMAWDDNQGTLSLIPDVDNFVIVTVTFEQFVATRKEVASISKELLNGEDDESKPGFIYLNGFYIEKCDDGSFYLPLGRNEYSSQVLSELEKILYDEHFHY